MDYSDSDADPYLKAALEAETLADKQRMDGFLGLLRGGIQAEGNSEEELEEICGELAKTSGVVPSGETNSWRV